MRPMEIREMNAIGWVFCFLWSRFRHKATRRFVTNWYAPSWSRRLVKSIYFLAPSCKFRLLPKRLILCSSMIICMNWCDSTPSATNFTRIGLGRKCEGMLLKSASQNPKTPRAGNFQISAPKGVSDRFFVAPRVARFILSLNQVGMEKVNTHTGYYRGRNWRESPKTTKNHVFRSVF